MKTLLLLTTLTLLLPSCTAVQKTDPEQELVNIHKPIHMGPPALYGRHGDYSYNLYPESVEIMALSPDMIASYADIFDTDSDGKFDSVWVMQRGKWSYCSTRQHPILVNTAGPEVLRDFIGLAKVIQNKKPPSYSSRLAWKF